MKHKQLTKNFNSKEFDSPDMPFSGLKMDSDFMKKLQKLRSYYGYPISIESGHRSETHNEAVGGVPDSTHVSFEGADVKARNSRERFLLVKLALLVGFTRIGINETTIHLDSSKDEDQRVLWHYY